MIRKIAAPLFTVLLLSACGNQPTAATEAMSNASAPDLNETVPAPAGSLIFCPEVQVRLTQQDCDDLTGVADKARNGVAAFNAPNSMIRGKPVTLQLAVGLAPEAQAGPAEAVATDNGSNDEMAEEGGGNVAEANRPRPHPAIHHLAKPQTPEDVVGQLPGKVVSYSPIVGRFMSATLTGDGFTIVPKSPESQEVYRDSQTVWEWQVTAVEPGSHALTLKTVVEGVTANGQHYALRSTVRNQTVTIERTLWQKIWDAIDAMPALLKAITAVVVALTALVTAIMALRKAFGKKDENKPRGD